MSSMKLLMIILDQGHTEELESFLDRAGVVGYTEVAPVRGKGRSGPRLGSGAFPKSSAMVFTLLSETALEELEGQLTEFCDSCEERPHVMAWSAEQLL